MEQTVTVGGVQYVAHRRTNLNEVNTRYFKRLIAVFYEGLAESLAADPEQVATVLVDYAHICGQVTGGTALLLRADPPEVFQAKCKAWLIDDTLFELGQALTELVNQVNAVQPDRALAPDPLPEAADPKASRAVKNSKRRRAPTG